MKHSLLRILYSMALTSYWHIVIKKIQSDFCYDIRKRISFIMSDVIEKLICYKPNLILAVLFVLSVLFNLILIFSKMKKKKVIKKLQGLI